MNRKKITLSLVAGALLGVAALFAGFLGAGHFLEAPAQSPVPADLMVALGGDNGARVDRVLELYREGFARRVLLTGPEGGYSRTRAAYLNWRARYLVDEGIPEKVLLYDRRAESSWEEAVNALQLMREMKLDRVLVVSDPPHMRRLSWVWGKVFSGSGKEYTLVASEMEQWDAAHWWRTSSNAQFVFGEYIKLGYYIFTY
ncbi:MAG TPA: YdcF family protein [Burkholderiales bacterium]|nr:YdcF family protein [Burkholderiales bacterium]